MKFSLIVILCGVALPVFAQQLTLAELSGTDQSALAEFIPQLARQALVELKDENADSYLANKFRLQTAARQYDEAVTTFETWSRQHTLAPGQRFDQLILLELFAKAKAAEARERESFESAFKKALSEMFSRFDDWTALEAGQFLAGSTNAVQGRLNILLGQLKSQSKIELTAALDLIRNYLAREALQSIAPSLGAAIAIDDANRYVIADDVLIKTKEGATLSAVVVRKKGVTEPQPASLFFNIYTDLRVHMREAKIATLHGYVGVAADARGKRLSPDTVAPYDSEVQDTYGVIDWISKQTWSNGKVGMYGSSYIGFAQWAAAKSLHPALKTIVPSVASHPGYGIPMENNVFVYPNYAWPLYVMDSKYLNEELYGDAQRWNSLNLKWYSSGRLYRELDALDGTPNRQFQRYLQHPSFDEYWQRMNPYKQDFAKIDIPILTLAGYFDGANVSSINYVLEHYKYKPRAEHYVLIGPYDHLNVKFASKDAVVGGYAIDPVAQINSVELTYQWFDYVMRNGPKPTLLKDKINYQSMGANVWRHAPSVRAMSNETLTLYLSDTKHGDRYDLTRNKPKNTGYLEQKVDFADRTTWNNLFSPRNIESEVQFDNSFVFVSEPFDAAVSVDGMISGELKATINKKDMDVALVFYELMPDGRYFKLANYLGRASYAGDMTKRKLLTPGTPATFPFERTQLISRQMSQGSRLVVFLTVNKNPWAQVNHGSGKDVSDETSADGQEPLHVRWHTDSFVKFPIRRAR